MLGRRQNAAPSFLLMHCSTACVLHISLMQGARPHRLLQNVPPQTAVFGVFFFLFFFKHAPPRQVVLFFFFLKEHDSLWFDPSLDVFALRLRQPASSLLPPLSLLILLWIPVTLCRSAACPLPLLILTLLRIHRARGV